MSDISDLFLDNKAIICYILNILFFQKSILEVINMYFYHIFCLIIFTLGILTLGIFGLTEMHYSTLLLINPAILNKLLFKIGQILYNISFREYALLHVPNQE